MPICNLFIKDKYKAKSLSKLVSFLTIGVNVTIKLLIIKMVQLIGLNTESRSAAIITLMIFTC